MHVRVGAPLSAFRHLSNLNLCLVVALVDAGASMADDVHADFLGNLQALHLGDHGGSEVVEALPGLLASPVTE